MIRGKDFSIIALLVIGICFLLAVTLLRCDGRPQRVGFVGTVERIEPPGQDHTTIRTASTGTPESREPMRSGEDNALFS